MEELILDVRMDKNTNLNDEDVNKLYNHGEKVVRMKNKSSEAMDMRYVKIFVMICPPEKCKDELNNVFLTTYLHPSS